MGLNEKWEPDGGAAGVAAVRSQAPASASLAEDDLPRFCLVPDAAESARPAAWVISICLAYLIVGLISFRPPAIVLHRHEQAPEEAVPTVIEPLVKPVQTGASESHAEEPSRDQNAEPGAPVVAVTADSAAIVFSVPTVGNVLVPLSMAQPPPEHPMQALTPVSSVKLEPVAAPKIETVSAPKIEQIGITGITGSRPPPSYPYESQMRGEQGAVVLRIEVAASGEVLSVTVKESSGFTLLDRAALDQVRRHWVFEPAEGKRLYDSRIVFRLK